LACLFKTLKYNTVNTGLSVQAGDTIYQPACLKQYSNLLACLFITVKHNTGWSVQTGDALYQPVCLKQ
jgi:hypothetical protein